ncbi:MAG: cryptochrome/photolyase family protein [Saprospiraceae bacterium]
MKVAKRLRLVLGDQLNSEHSWWKEQSDDTLYLMMETRSETTYTKHHIQKVVAFFGAMRAFATARREEGHRVYYIYLDDKENRHTVRDNVRALLNATGAEEFGYQLPDEWRLDEELRGLAREITVDTKVADTEHFLTTRERVAETFEGKKTFLMETFYRSVRKQYGYLMEVDGETPLTGKWNYDHENRGKLKKGMELPEKLEFKRDVTELVELIERMEIPTMGRIEPTEFFYPLTRNEGLQLVHHFTRHTLRDFGTYQDAMTRRDRLLFHSQISFAMNAKLIGPQEVCDICEDYWREHQEEIGINQIEGYIRQIIGWREYMRGVYWARMPEYETLNALEHDRPLPKWYWTGEVKANCLNHAVNQSLDYAYAHHIQRLMITGNFALLLGAHPDEVDDWYLGVYIDAVQWVEITNTRGMSQWADGGLVATKPYASSANYINKMSDYCKKCVYDPKKRVGEGACPFNSLYWDFLERHRERFERNPRMTMMYRAWERFAGDDRAAILEQAQWVKDHQEEL